MTKPDQIADIRARHAGPWKQYDDEGGVRTVRHDDRGRVIAAAWHTHAGVPWFEILGEPRSKVSKPIQPDLLEAAKLAADLRLAERGWVFT